MFVQLKGLLTTSFNLTTGVPLREAPGHQVRNAAKCHSSWTAFLCRDTNGSALLSAQLSTSAVEGAGDCHALATAAFILNI